MRQAWLSGDWSRVADGESGPLSSAAKLLQDAPLRLASSEISLQDAENLFSASAEARETILGMLEATRLEDVN